MCQQVNRPLSCALETFTWKDVLMCLGMCLLYIIILCLDMRLNIRLHRLYPCRHKSVLPGGLATQYVHNIIHVTKSCNLI